MGKLVVSAFLTITLFSALNSPVNAGFVGTPPIAAIEESGSPTFMIGIAVEFGDTAKSADVGFTAKVISSNKPNEFVFGGGLTFFPWAKEQVGVDLGVGYNFNNFNALAGYDFLRGKPQLSIGYVPTDRNYSCNDSDYQDLVGNICNFTGLPPT